MRVIGAGVLAVLLAGAASAQMTPAKFVETAGASDKFEMDSAKVMQGSKNPKVAAFANKMLTDHGKSTMMVMTAAKADHVAPAPASLTVKQRTDITALKAVPAGKTKDDLYVKQQKASHGEALALMKSYASSGSAAHLKAAAGKIEPVVQGHVNQLNAI